jgi:hypothetical protein
VVIAATLRQKWDMTIPSSFADYIPKTLSPARGAVDRS